MIALKQAFKAHGYSFTKKKDAYVARSPKGRLHHFHDLDHAACFVRELDRFQAWLED